MSITTDKMTIGASAWDSRVKFAHQRAEEDEHVTSDVGVLWAADKMADLEKAMEIVKGWNAHSEMEVRDMRIAAALELGRVWIDGAWRVEE